MDVPGDPRECRKHAARCAELAANAKSIEVKKAYRELALRWNALAIQLETLQRALNDDGGGSEPKSLKP
jgi:hypothetical protein